MAQKHRSPTLKRGGSARPDDDDDGVAARMRARARARAGRRPSVRCWRAGSKLVGPPRDRLNREVDRFETGRRDTRYFEKYALLAVLEEKDV